MVRVPIREVGTDKYPSRFCDVVVDGNGTYLEQKTAKKITTINWEDFKRQVELAQEKANKN